jgi:lipopolysaccharide/colanic/teichoic acid biosynthesis glycosyltransferase
MAGSPHGSRLFSPYKLIWEVERMVSHREDAAHTPPNSCGAVVALISRIVALGAVLLYLPTLLALAALVAGTSHGPAIVRKAFRRAGEAGSLVYLYEFRTECWRSWRPTPIGSLLAGSDLHRLPRLFNVLLGDVTMGEILERVT